MGETTLSEKLIPIVLASASRARTKVLSDAGVDHIQDPANIDEAAIKDTWYGRPEALARELARAKAEALADKYPNAMIIGADQVLALGQKIVNKPGDPTRVRRQLDRLRGREHRLISAVAVSSQNNVVWDHVATAHMYMRPFSDDFLDAYVAKVGDDVAMSAGAYHLANMGAQLFENVEGDFFTVLGLPLIPLLNFLRSRGALQS
ncbi:MAG: septum formation protein Maf [Arenibacter algicola]|nr:septum formation protein Maf [Arenibacter algicola]